MTFNLSVNNISFSYYSSKKLLRDVSFHVSEGEILLLQGQNGAGKTTLLQILAGLKKGFQGNYTIREFAFLEAEKNGLLLDLSAYEQLLFWKNDSKIVNEKLSYWIPSWESARDLPVLKFSTGLKRRVALARLSLVPRKIYLLDEPLSGLDQKAGGLFKSWIKTELQNQNSFLIASHDIDFFNDLEPKCYDLN